MLAEHDGAPVLVRDGKILVAAFHPELTDDTRVHAGSSTLSGRRALSGHSKWSSTSKGMGAADAKRGQLFSKLSRAIIVAARDGGPDPEGNSALATAIQKARDNSMPKDNIERAIARGSGAVSDGQARTSR